MSRGTKKITLKLLSSAVFAEISAGEFVVGKHTAVRTNTCLHLRRLFTLSRSTKYTAFKAVLRESRATRAKTLRGILGSHRNFHSFSPPPPLDRHKALSLIHIS